MKIHELKIKKSLNESRTYLTWNVEMNDVDARVVTDRQTDRHTDTQDNYRNPPAHVHQGLMMLLFGTPSANTGRSS